MPSKSYEIRVCASCGLRYPLVDKQNFGRRCPACLGETRVVLRRELIHERVANLPSTDTSPVSTHQKRADLALLLDNIRSAWNVGSILRSADGFGFAHAYLCGLTPTPDNEAVQKTSLGAEETVTWSYHKDAVKLVRGLKKEGWKIFALEEDERAHQLGGALNETYNSLMIAGNEITGVDPELLGLCDEIFFIPMRGEKKSFNVSIAFGIAAYALAKK